MHSPDGTNVYGARGREFGGRGWVSWVESCKIAFLAKHFLFTCSDTCCRMYHAVTTDSIADRQTDGQHRANSQSHCMHHGIQSSD